ncbi:MAG: hypothetical protein JNM94_14975 [Phycisphaerae bacterium]|nr:hypothetical protein [Phycisphaerae bacterium]
MCSFLLTALVERSVRVALSTMTLSAALAGVSIASCAHSQIIYVDADSPAPDGGDGLSWQSAFRDLQDALAAAQAAGGSTIWLAEGTYRPDYGTGLRYLAFELSSGTTILGGFAGNELAADERDPVAHPTVLSGDLLANDGPDFANRTDNAFSVVRVWNALDAAILDGLTILGGAGDGPAIFSGGGGLVAIGSTVLVNDCIFTSNLGNSGGSARAIFSSISFSDTAFEDSVAQRGAGVYLHYSEATLNACHFSGNVAQTNSLEYGGGAIAAHGSTVTASDCTFVANVAFKTGGAIHLLDSALSAQSCHFEGNEATTLGGAVKTFLGGAPLVLNGCSFLGNSVDLAPSYGGAIWCDVPIVLDSCLFQGNTAKHGAAMYVSETSSTGDSSLAGVTVIDNYTSDAVFGGALIYRAPGELTIDRCLFEANYTPTGSSSKGGAVNADSTGPLVVRSTTFRKNVAGSADALRTTGQAVLVEDCLFEENGASLGTVAVMISSSPQDVTQIIRNSHFLNNACGALFVGSSGYVFDCLFEKNSLALPTSSFTSAAGLSGSPRQVVRCDFLDNHAASGAGAIQISTGVSNSDVVVLQCRFLGNHAGPLGAMSMLNTSEGPAIARTSYSFSGTIEFANCVFSGNVCTNGGPTIAAYGTADLRLRSSTVAGNISTGPNAGVRSDWIDITSEGDYLYAKVTLQNCIIWGNNNNSQAAALAVAAGCQLKLDSSCVQGWTGSFGGNDNHGLDPSFVDADGRDNASGTIDDDLRLMAGSPSINSGNALFLTSDHADLDGDGILTEPIPIDLDGGLRVVKALDRGAYERQSGSDSRYVRKRDWPSRSHPSSSTSR